MRVATFNIQHGLPAGGGPVDARAVVAACAALGTDVLGLQEVDRRVRRSGRNDLPAAVADALGLTLAWGRTLRTGGGEYGNALLVRGALADVESLVLPRPRWAEPRGALLARVAVDGVAASVAVTHLGLRRDESLRQLEAVLDRLAVRPSPRILMGDFNRFPAEVEPVLAAAGLETVATEAAFPAHAPSKRIDYIAVDGFAVAGTMVAKTPISDHRAVVADLVADV